MSFARVFTGFQQQDLRGNIEVGNRAVFNSIDPMKILLVGVTSIPNQI